MIEGEGGATQRTKEAPSLRRTVVGLMPVTAATQALGFASSVALAQYLGATSDTDAYYLALLLPGLASGIITAALRQGAIPALSEEESDPSSDSDLSGSASALVSGVTVLALLLAVILCLVGLAIAQLAAFGSQSQDLSKISLYSTLLIPYTAGAAAQGAMAAALAVKGKFKLAVAVYGFESMAKIVFTVGFTSLGGLGLVAGNLVGQAAALVALWVALRRIRVTIKPVRFVRNPVLKIALVTSAPLVASASVLQVNPFIDRGVAASLGAGSVTALELATRVVLIPQALLAASLISPLIATWAGLKSRSGWEPVERSFTRALRVAWVGSALVAALCIPLRHHLVELIYGGRAFTKSDISQTADVLGILMLSLPASVVMIPCSSLFVVRKETTFPMKVGISNVVMNTGLTLAFASIIGLPGVALGTAITMTINMVTYFLGIARRWSGINLPMISGALLRSTLSAILAGLATMAAIGFLSGLQGVQALELPLSGLIGCFVFAGGMLALDGSVRAALVSRVGRHA